MADRLAVIQSTETVAELEKIDSKVQSLVGSFKNLVHESEQINKGLSKGTPKEFVDSIGKLNKLIDDYEKRSKSVKTTMSEVERLHKRIAVASSEEGREASKLRLHLQDLNKENKELAKATQYVISAYDQLNREHEIARKKALDLGVAQGITSREFLKAAAEANAYDQKLKMVDASLGKFGRNVGNYQGGMFGLSAQMQQVMREMPNFAIDARIGIMSLTNNLPMLGDAIADVNRKIKEQKAEFKAGALAAKEKAIADALAAGQSEKSAIAAGKHAEALVMQNYQMSKQPSLLKQIAGSVFNWQTLLVVGISLIMVYNKEITKWVTELFKGKQAVNAAKQATEDFNEAKKEGNKNAAQEIVNSEILYRTMKDESLSRRDRAAAAKELQDMYPQIFGNMSTEQMMVGNTSSKYLELRDAIMASAIAEAMKNKMAQRTQEFLDKEEESLAKIGQKKIEIAKLEKSENNKGQIISGGTMGSSVTIDSKNDRVRWANDELNELRNIRAADIKSQKEYMDRMTKMAINYQITGNKTKKPDTPKKQKAYSGAKLTGEQKDALNDLKAWQDNELALIKEQKLNNQITEVEYWEKYIIIQKTYRNKVLALLDGSNAKERLINADARKKAIDELEKANKEIFEYEKKRLDSTNKLYTENQKNKLDTIKNDPYLTEVEKIAQQTEVYNYLIAENNNYYAELIKSAKKYNQDIFALENERDAKTGSYQTDRDTNVGNMPKALEKDLEYSRTIEATAQKLSYEEAKRVINANQLLSLREKEYQLSLLDKRNTLEVLNSKKAIAEADKDRLSKKAEEGELTREEKKQWGEILLTIGQINNEIDGTNKAIEDLQTARLKDQLQPIADILAQGFQGLGLDRTASEFQSFYDTILDKNATFADKFRETFELVSSFASDLIEQQTAKRIATLDEELNKSRERSDLELDIVSKRLDMLTKLNDLSKEQLDERNALEDEARAIKEQQLEREKQIEAEKARAIQRANAQQTLIAGMQGAVMAYTSQLIPGDPTSVLRGLAAAGSTLAFAGVQAALIMSKDPVPKYFKGRKGGKAEWALTQEHGREIITDKYGNVTDTGNDKGAKMTWLNEGDNVYTASETEKILNDIGKSPKIGDNLFRKAAKQNVAPVFIQQDNIDYDKFADKVGQKFDSAFRKYDKVSYVEDQNGNMIRQEGGKIPVNVGKKRKQRIEIKVKGNGRD